MEGLDLDNILDDEDMGLFTEQESQEDDSQPEEKEGEDGNKDSKDTVEIDPNNLFGDGSESVDSEENNMEDASFDNSQASSPKFFSSIAETFADEGILPNLDKETIENIKTPEDFRKAIDEYIQSELTEQQRRVAEALDNNVPPDAIRWYENTMASLNNITPDMLKEEGDEGEALRTQVLYQDYLNRGFSQARAEKEVKKSLDNGTDIEDAEEAMASLRSFYQRQYQFYLENARQQQEVEQSKRNAAAVNFRNKIMDEKTKFFGDTEVDKSTRQQIYDNISKPVYKDPETGEFLTALQRYEREHTDDFIMNVGTLYTLTNGFKDLSRLTQGKVKKEIKKSLRDLESRINNTTRDTSGNLKFTSGTGGNSYFGKGLKLDI